MSTNDVPGARAENNDELAMGCWAEHQDGSLIFVESTEGSRVVYSIFDASVSPVVEYRDSMPEVNFKRHFSWSTADRRKDRWTWHDKTPFDWDRVIRKGARDGLRFASADGLETAAQRVAASLQLRGREYIDRHSHMVDQEISRDGAVLAGLAKALAELPSAIGAAVSKAVTATKRKRK